jgi:hypothetical protein
MHAVTAFYSEATIVSKCYFNMILEIAEKTLKRNQ